VFAKSAGDRVTELDVFLVFWMIVIVVMVCRVAPGLDITVVVECERTKKQKKIIGNPTTRTLKVVQAC
jgi:hypothetical protein